MNNKCPNEYRIDGDTTYLTVTNRKGQQITAAFDTSDLDKVRRRQWCAQFMSRRWYLATAVASGSVLNMHRYLMDPPAHQRVGHHDHDSLNYRKANLYVATHATIMRRRIDCDQRDSGHPNVTWCEQRQQWHARTYMTDPTVKGGKRRIHVGYFDDPDTAAKALAEFDSSRKIVRPYHRKGGE